jgi:hypothetical protein
MTDPRFDAARRTDQSGGRGWDFTDKPREPFRPSIILAIAAVVILASMAVVAASSMIGSLS